MCNAADEPKISPTAAEELFWNEIETEVTAEDALDATATSMTRRTEPPPRGAGNAQAWLDGHQPCPNYTIQINQVC